MKNKIRRKSNKSTTRATTGNRLDLRRPKMFSDELFEDRVKKAEKISDLKNLGPASEQAFAKANIYTAQQFVRLGWKKTYEKLVLSNKRNLHTVFAYALIGALTNKEWNRLSDEEKLNAKTYTQVLREKLVTLNKRKNK